MSTYAAICVGSPVFTAFLTADTARVTRLGVPVTFRLDAGVGVGVFVGVFEPLSSFGSSTIRTAALLSELFEDATVTYCFAVTFS